MKQVLSGLLILFSVIVFSCKQKPEVAEQVAELNVLAEKYVRLGLIIGQYDPDFVDAYYGPDSLKPDPKLKQPSFPKDSLLLAVSSLKDDLSKFELASKDSVSMHRAEWLSAQLSAFAGRIRIFSGEFKSFDEESKDLFGVVAPEYPETHYIALINQLDTILPGQRFGTIAERFQVIANYFKIPPDRVDTVFKAAIAEARARTGKYIDLPEGEDFKLEYVKDKPWSGYNWYKGDYKSTIQINIDLPIYIDRAIDLGCHEGYPGHHVYNFSLEKNLYRDKGWVELSFYPLFSPQSLIAEGSANFGIDMAFPEGERLHFTKEVLLPLAKLDTGDTGLYFRALAIKTKLNYARNEAARGLLSGKMDEKEALRWLTSYCLFTEDNAMKSISFIRKYRSYVINYNYGLDLVKNYIEGNGGTNQAIERRWQLFEGILSTEVLPSELLYSKK